jgi:hypothetical protein
VQNGKPHIIEKVVDCVCVGRWNLSEWNLSELTFWPNCNPSEWNLLEGILQKIFSAKPESFRMESFQRNLSEFIFSKTGIFLNGIF